MRPAIAATTHPCREISGGSRDQYNIGRMRKTKTRRPQQRRKDVAYSRVHFEMSCGISRGRLIKLRIKLPPECVGTRISGLCKEVR